MWSNVRKLAGVKQKFTFQPLIHQNQVYESPSEISELLANTYAKISANTNYDSTFIDHKVLSENIPLDFSAHPSPNPNLPYNHPVTEQEVKQTFPTAPSHQHLVLTKFVYSCCTTSILTPSLISPLSLIASSCPLHSPPLGLWP